MTRRRNDRFWETRDRPQAPSLKGKHTGPGGHDEMSGRPPATDRASNTEEPSLHAARPATSRPLTSWKIHPGYDLLRGRAERSPEPLKARRYRGT